MHHNMKYYALLFAVASLHLVSCKSDAPSGQQGAGQDITAQLAGHWIAMDFCSRSNQYGSVLGAMTNSHVPYAYSLSFDPAKPDSVVCHNGMEQWSLPVKFNADTIEIMNARPGKSVFLIYHSQGKKDMSMFDSTTGKVQMDNFIKSNANARDGYTAFTTALNHNLFSGLFGEIGKTTGNPAIQFTPGGFILNWKPYDRFEVCTAGDCFVMDNNMDIVTLRKASEKDSGVMYGFQYNGTNDTLTLFNLVNTNPEEKGAYTTKGVAYRFFRKPAE